MWLLLLLLLSLPCHPCLWPPLVRRLLRREGQLGIRGCAARAALPVRPQPAGRDVALVAAAADEGALVGVESLVELEVDVLGELAGAAVAGVRFGAAEKVI